VAAIRTLATSETPKKRVPEVPVRTYRGEVIPHLGGVVPKKVVLKKGVIAGIGGGKETKTGGLYMSLNVGGKTGAYNVSQVCKKKKKKKTKKKKEKQKKKNGGVYKGVAQRDPGGGPYRKR